MPFNTPQAKAERERRKRANEDRLYSGLVSLMNDVKWDEVFMTLVQREIFFQLQLVGWSADKFCPLIHPPAPGLFNRANGCVDGLLGAGFYYYELQCVRCPAVIPGSMVLSSKPHQQDLAGLAEALRSLGKLPITETSDHLNISGYQQPSSHVKP
jgi:hypothetical protein